MGRRMILVQAQRTHFVLPSPLNARLAVASATLGVSRSALARAAITQFLDGLGGGSHVRTGAPTELPLRPALASAATG